MGLCTIIASFSFSCDIEIKVGQFFCKGLYTQLILLPRLVLHWAQHLLHAKLEYGTASFLVLQFWDKMLLCSIRVFLATSPSLPSSGFLLFHLVLSRDRIYARYYSTPYWFAPNSFCAQFNHFAIKSRCMKCPFLSSCIEIIRLLPLTSSLKLQRWKIKPARQWREKVAEREIPSVVVAIGVVYLKKPTGTLSFKLCCASYANSSTIGTLLHSSSWMPTLLTTSHYASKFEFLELEADRGWRRLVAPLNVTTTKMLFKWLQTKTERCVERNLNCTPGFVEDVMKFLWTVLGRESRSENVFSADWG